MSMMMFKEIATSFKTMADKMPDFSKNMGNDLSKANSDLKQPTFQNENSFNRLVPENNGSWLDEKGNSSWKPDGDFVPQKHNPDQKSWQELSNEFDFDTIPFEDGEPDFTMISEASEEIADFTTERSLNFKQADEALAEKWSETSKDGKAWTPQDVKQYRQENKLTWHERSDQKTMDLVPSVVHGNISHSGGISAAKNGA